LIDYKLNLLKYRGVVLNTLATVSVLKIIAVSHCFDSDWPVFSPVMAIWVVYWKCANCQIIFMHTYQQC